MDEKRDDRRADSKPEQVPGSKHGKALTAPQQRLRDYDFLDAHIPSSALSTLVPLAALGRTL